MASHKTRKNRQARRQAMELRHRMIHFLEIQGRPVNGGRGLTNEVAARLIATHFGAVLLSGEKSWKFQITDLLNDYERKNPQHQSRQFKAQAKGDRLLARELPDAFGHLAKARTVAPPPEKRTSELPTKLATPSTKYVSPVPGPAFYDTDEWRRLRYRALKLHGGACQCCGRKPPLVVLHVDHVKPRSRFPELELDINNLQVLCADCNLGKGAWDATDWRRNVVPLRTA